MSDRTDVIADFWRGIDSHDWDLIASTLADDFVRIGMNGGANPDICEGKEAYLKFVSTVISKMDHHDLRVVRTFTSSDGRLATVEAVETIRPPESDVMLPMQFVNVMELDDEGLIKKLDIYWKTPDQLPPSWIAVEDMLAEADG